jgi:hypothetical protein
MNVADANFSNNYESKIQIKTKTNNIYHEYLAVA